MKHVNEDDVRNVNMDNYAKDYSEDNLWYNVRENASSIGLTVIYKAF